MSVMLRHSYNLPSPETVAQAVGVYQVCRVVYLGENSNRVAYFLKSNFQVDDGTIIGYNDLDAIIRRITRSAGHCSACIAFHFLVRLRYKKKVPDPEEFAEWLGSHPSLEYQMKHIDEEYKGRRSGVKQQKANKAAQQARLNRKASENSQSATEHHIGAEAARKLGKKFSIVSCLGLAGWMPESTISRAGQKLSG
ncbi:hypothetical protein P154DRAFT_540255 [Amniculicola lignicola CBS 123094]|uniref:Uncharacterized protein n=1 Tax=Amniculicola lignicola CBS 123094 TaxID=1392246 RepID=A0A6A5VY59_9PLEO|nr:hypothetical protein P154DRAFT_540255 [Amniculicola lignicola CBS 123094]